MKKGWRLMFLLSLTTCMLAGCGQEKVPETMESSAIAVSGKGQIAAYLVEAFDKSYYDISELSAMAVKEAEEFNAARKDQEGVSVTVEQVELLGDAKVKLAYRFDDWKTYTAFSEEELFFGTVNEAKEKGYLAGVSLRSVKDGTVIGEEQLAQSGDKMLIVTNAAADIYCPAKVTHVSEGVSVNADGSVAAGQTEGFVYILLK